MTARNWLQNVFGRGTRRRRLDCLTSPKRAQLSLDALEDRAVPAVLTVNSLLDNTTAGDGLVTLREAVNAANADRTTDLGQTGSGADAIVFNPALFDGTPRTITLSLGQLSINSDLSITGPGAAALTISGNHASRVFNVNNFSSGSVTVQITDLTMSGGSADSGGAVNSFETLTLTRVVLTGNAATSAGGGVANSGTLTIADSALTGNSARDGGGAIDNGGGGKVTITGSTISYNSVTDGVFSSDGGGITNFMAGSTVTIINSTLVGNSARDFGGGICNDAGAALFVTNSTISGNTANIGAGIANLGTGRASTATILGSTLSGNTAHLAADGGIVGTGGGIFNDSSSVALTNSTLTGNTAAAGEGGGIRNQGTRATGTLTLNNTIVANSTGGEIVEYASVALSGSHNLIEGENPAGLTGTITADPLLGPLADNGGPTLTHALLAGSPAIDAGSDALVPAGVTTDQRGPGFPRFVGTVDIGAFEASHAPPVAVAGGPYTVAEGGSVVLDASGSTAVPGAGPLTYAWDFDGDGQFDDATGTTPTFSAAGLDGTDTRTIGLRVTDADGLSSTTTAVVTVTNVAPTAGVSGPSAALPGQPLAFTLTATDPSVADAAAGFTYTVNWGDGSPAEVVAASARNGAGIALAHAYATFGTYTVRVTATDKDGGTSPTAATTIDVEPAAVLADPLHPGQNALYISGTAADDTITVDLSATGQFVVTLVSLPAGQAATWTGTFDGPLSRLVIDGGTGNDTITVDAHISTDAWLYGGVGNDVLTGGGGNDLLLGGDGDDILTARGGSDVVIGGAGADYLSGGGGGDLMIAGSTAFDLDEVALSGVQLEWTSGRDYLTRVANLRGTGSGPRANGNVFLIASGPGQTVFSDESADYLKGGAGRDWYFANRTGGGVIDRVVGLGGTEELDDLV